MSFFSKCRKVQPLKKVETNQMHIIYNIHKNVQLILKQLRNVFASFEWILKYSHFWDSINVIVFFAAKILRHLKAQHKTTKLPRGKFKLGAKIK